MLSDDVVYPAECAPFLVVLCFVVVMLSEVGVTKPPFVDLSVSKIFDFAKVPIRFF